MSGPVVNSRPIRGIGLAAALLGSAVAWAAWRAQHNTVVLTSASTALPATTSQNWPDMRIDVNSAPAAELSLLPGIGPALAQRIIDDRRENGPFESIDELDRVKGIGPVTVQKVRPFAVAESIGATVHLQK